MHAVLLLSAALSLLGCAFAHMEVMKPPPRQSKYNPYSTSIDYDMMAPLWADGLNFPCKNYEPLQNVQGGRAVFVRRGQAVSMAACVHACRAPCALLAAHLLLPCDAKGGSQVALAPPLALPLLLSY